MKRDNERAWQGTREVEVDICPSIIWNIAFLYDALLFQFLVSKLVGTKNLVFLRLSPRALTLASNIV
jgi:hypothetical protein